MLLFRNWQIGMCNSVRSYFSFPCEYSCLGGQRRELNLQTLKTTTKKEHCQEENTVAVCFLEQARIASGSCWGSPWQKLSRCRSGAVRQGPGAGWELSCLCVGTPGWPAGHLARIRGLPEPSCWGHGGSAWRVLCILPQDVICCVLNITVLGLGAACYGLLWLAVVLCGSTPAPALIGCCCFPKLLCDTKRMEKCYFHSSDAIKSQPTSLMLCHALTSGQEGWAWAWCASADRSCKYLVTNASVL